MLPSPKTLILTWFITLFWEFCETFVSSVCFWPKKNLTWLEKLQLVCRILKFWLPLKRHRTLFILVPHQTSHWFLCYFAGWEFWGTEFDGVSFSPFQFWNANTRLPKKANFHFVPSILQNDTQTRWPNFEGTDVRYQMIGSFLNACIDHSANTCSVFCGACFS